MPDVSNMELVRNKLTAGKIETCGTVNVMCAEIKKLGLPRFD